MLSVAASVSEEGTQLPGRYYPTPPHPTPPHLETMPCWVWPQVCQRKERSCQDHPTPPPRIWGRCHVECGRKCVRGRNAAARTLLSHPTPPHPPASGDDAMLSVAASVSEEGTQLPGRYYPTPPHPPRHLETMLCWLWPQLWRGCWFLSRADGGWGIAFFWLRNLVLVAESPFFCCGIVFFWLRNRLFLVAEAPFFGCGSVSDFGCGIAEIWLRKRRNMVSESEFIPYYGTTHQPALGSPTSTSQVPALDHLSPRVVSATFHSTSPGQSWGWGMLWMSDIDTWHSRHRVDVWNIL